MLTQFKTWYIHRKMYKQTIKELSSLSSHELHDLGITPEMIPAVAIQATYGVK